MKMRKLFAALLAVLMLCSIIPFAVAAESASATITFDVSSSVVPFSSHLQSFPPSGCFQMSQVFASGGQSIGAAPASASVLLMNIQD